MSSLALTLRSAWALPAGAGLISAVLFASSLWVPPVGYVLCLASPLPVALAARRWGVRGGVPAAIAGTLGAAVVAGPLGAAAFLTQFAAGGCLIGLAARARCSPEVVVGGYALLATAASLGALGLVTLQGEHGSAGFVGETVRDSVESILLQGESDPSAAAVAQSLMEQTSRFLSVAFPGMLAVIATLTGWANAVALRRLVPDPQAKAWAAWRAPERWIWVLVGSGLVGLLGKGALATLGLNVFLAALGAYFLQGVAIVQNLFETRRFPQMFRAVAYVLLFCQLPMMLVVAGLGAFDLWFDFRSRWSPTPVPPKGPSENN